MLLRGFDSSVIRCTRTVVVFIAEVGLSLEEVEAALEIPFRRLRPFLHGNLSLLPSLQPYWIVRFAVYPERREASKKRLGSMDVYN